MANEKYPKVLNQYVDEDGEKIVTIDIPLCDFEAIMEDVELIGRLYAHRIQDWEHYDKALEGLYDN